MASAESMLRQKAKQVRRFPGDELPKQVQPLRKSLLSAASGATGGDRAFSGMGGTPKLGVSARTLRGSRTVTVTLKPSPRAAAGPWRWAQDGTEPGMRRHRSGARRGTLMDHPGTSGSNAWDGPVEAELPKIRKALQRQFDALMR